MAYILKRQCKEKIGFQSNSLLFSCNGLQMVLQILNFYNCIIVCNYAAIFLLLSSLFIGKDFAPAWIEMGTRIGQNVYYVSSQYSVQCTHSQQKKIHLKASAARKNYNMALCKTRIFLVKLAL